MIVQNLTFVVPSTIESTFLKALDQAVTLLPPTVNSFKVFSVLEQIDPEAVSFAVQLEFSDPSYLESFTNQSQSAFISRLQEDMPEQLLFFASHLRQVR